MKTAAASECEASRFGRGEIRCDGELIRKSDLFCVRYSQPLNPDRLK
jgi:hypothetical protein